MTSLGIVPGINFFVSGHFLILFIDLTNLPEALCVQKICRGIIHFDPTMLTYTHFIFFSYVNLHTFHFL